MGKSARWKASCGIADIHHDLCLWPRQIAQVDCFHFIFERAVVDESEFAFGTRNRDHLAILEDIGAILGSDDRRQPEFPAYDCGVAGAAASVGDDGGGFLHRRFPIGVGFLGNQNVTVAYFLKILHVLHDPHRPLCDLFSDASPLYQNLASCAEVIDRHRVNGFLRLHGLRSCLDDEQFPGAPVLSPFHIHYASWTVFAVLLWPQILERLGHDMFDVFDLAVAYMFGEHLEDCTGDPL